MTSLFFRWVSQIFVLFFHVYNFIVSDLYFIEYATKEAGISCRFL